MENEFVPAVTQVRINFIDAFEQTFDTRGSTIHVSTNAADCFQKRWQMIILGEFGVLLPSDMDTTQPESVAVLYGMFYIFYLRVCELLERKAAEVVRSPTFIIVK